MVACGNAARQVLSPLIIFDRDAKNIQQRMRCQVRTMYGSSDKGWINTDLFESWFYDLFY